MQTLLRHKLILFVVAIVVAGAIWYGLSGSGSSTSLLSTQTPTVSSDPATQALVTTLLALRAVTLNGTIFSDPSFVSLQDFSTAIVPEPVGRPNPFAPLAPEASASASTTRSAQIFTPR